MGWALSECGMTAAAIEPKMGNEDDPCGQKQANTEVCVLTTEAKNKIPGLSGT